MPSMCIAKPLDELFESIHENTAISFFQWEICGRWKSTKTEDCRHNSLCKRRFEGTTAAIWQASVQQQEAITSKKVCNWVK